MKRTLIIIAAAAFSAMAVTSCGGGESKEVAVRDAEVYGDLYYYENDTDSDWIDSFDDDYISIPDGIYDFHIQDGMLNVSVPVTVVKHIPMPDKIQSISVDEFVLGLYDAEGNEIKDKDGNDVYLKLTNPENLSYTLRYQMTGEKETLHFSYALLGETGILEKINSFYIMFDLDVYMSSDDNDGDDSQYGGYAEEQTGNRKKSSGSASSSEIDDLIDSYEDLVNQYVKVGKEVKDGDLFAVAKYNELAGKATKLSDRLDELEDDEMTEEQYERFMEIYQKMIESTTDILF